MKISYPLLGTLFSALVVLPFGLEAYSVGKTAWFFLCLAYIFVALSFSIRKQQRFSVNTHRLLFVVISLYVLSLIFSTLFSIAPLQSLLGLYGDMTGSAVLLLICFCFLLFLHAFGDQKFRLWFFLAIVGIGLLTSSYALFQHFGVDPLAQQESERFLGRVYSTFGHPNYLGQWLIFPLVFLFGAVCSREEKLTLKALGILLAFILVAAAFGLTSNRASFLGVAVSFVLFCFFMLHHPKQRYLILSVVFLLGLGFILIQYHLSELLPRSLMSRLVLWQSASGAIGLEMLPFGYGLHSTYQVLLQHLKPQLFLYENLFTIPHSVHNAVLSAFLEQGVLGLVLPLSQMIFLIWVYLNRRIRGFWAYGSYFALLAYSISLMFSYSSIEHLLVLAAFWALLLHETEVIREVPVQCSKITASVLSVFLVGLAGVSSFAAYSLVKTDMIYANARSSYIENASESYSEFTQLIYTPFPFAEPAGTAFHFFLPFSEEFSVSPFRAYLSKVSNDDVFSQLADIELEYEGGFFDFADINYSKLRSQYPTAPFLYTRLGMMDVRFGRCGEANEKMMNLRKLLPPQAGWENNVDAEKQDKFRIFKKGNPQLFHFAEVLQDCEDGS